MTTTDFSGLDIVKALTKNRFYVVDRMGSHVKLRYEHPDNEEDIRVVTVPDEGSNPPWNTSKYRRPVWCRCFKAWYEWIDQER